MRYSTHHAYPNAEVALHCQLLYKIHAFILSHGTFVLQFGGSHYCKIGNPTCNPLFLLINWINHQFLKLVCLNRNADVSAKPYLHSCHENDTRCNDGKRFQLHESPLGLPGESAFSSNVAACSDVLLLSGNGQNCLHIPIPSTATPKKMHIPKGKNHHLPTWIPPKRRKARKKKHIFFS